MKTAIESHTISFKKITIAKLSSTVGKNKANSTFPTTIWL